MKTLTTSTTDTKQVKYISLGSFVDSLEALVIEAMDQPLKIKQGFESLELETLNSNVIELNYIEGKNVYSWEIQETKDGKLEAFRIH